MKRIDKIISEQTNFTRKEIKKMISNGRVCVNDILVKKSEEKYDETKIQIMIDNKSIEVKKHIYLVLNKPKGYISSTETENSKTVLDLVPNEFKTRELFPAGRLDKDTTGLMIITDDGKFAHNILSPKKHVKKIYEVILDIELTEKMVNDFKNGINLKDGECNPAILEIKGKYFANVTLREGRYHQIKRMFGCYGAKVIELNRICIGNFILPKELKVGDIRELTERELELIQEKNIQNL